MKVRELEQWEIILKKMKEAEGLIPPDCFIYLFIYLV
jgi:hypothetical protein